MREVIAQIERANKMASLMAQDGHEVLGVDLLDYLTICGFVLEEETNTASDAYFTKINEWVAKK